MTGHIIVTGATGTVGGAVMRHLMPEAEAGRITLRGAARNDVARQKLQDHGHIPVELDFDRPETLRPALRGASAVFLATGYSAAMLVQSKLVLDAARAEGVGHVVHLGAMAAEDTPHAHFAWHQLIERAIEGMGFSWTHLHPNFFMDTVWQGFCHRPDRLVHFVGHRPVSWIAAHDIAAVAAQSLLHPGAHSGKAYELAAQSLSFDDLAHELTRITGQEVRHAPRPAADLLPLLLKQGMDPGYATGLAAGVAAIEAGEMAECNRVSDDVQRVTGKPPTLWQDFAAARLDQIKASGR